MTGRSVALLRTHERDAQHHRSLTDVSWRSPHVSQRWRGCESKWSHAMYER